MYLLHFMQKIIVNGSHSQTTVFIYKCRLRCSGATLRSPDEATKYLLGQKHIYLKSLKRSASNGTIFNWKFRSEICLIFFFKRLNIFLLWSMFGVLARPKWKLKIFIILVFGVIRSPNNMKVVLILKDFARRFHLYQF